MKKLHYNTVSKTLTKCLKELMNEPLLKDFVLVGGTSLSLQLGHRVSIDIDLFTDSLYGSVNFNAIQEMLRGKFNFIPLPAAPIPRLQLFYYSIISLGIVDYLVAKQPKVL